MYFIFNKFVITMQYINLKSLYSTLVTHVGMDMDKSKHM